MPAVGDVGVAGGCGVRARRRRVAVLELEAVLRREPDELRALRRRQDRSDGGELEARRGARGRARGQHRLRKKRRVSFRRVRRVPRVGARLVLFPRGPPRHFFSNLNESGALVERDSRERARDSRRAASASVSASASWSPAGRRMRSASEGASSSRRELRAAQGIERVSTVRVV